MTNDNTPPSVVYIALGNTLYKGTPNIRLWTADAEQARLFEQETKVKAHEYRLVAGGITEAEQAAWHAGIEEGRSQRQTVPAAVAVADLVREALETARNGLVWYREQCPDAVDGSDDEADALIVRALAAIDETPQPPAPAPAQGDALDAARYRWLRKHRSIDLHANPSVPWVVRCEFQPIPTTVAIVEGDLDAAIDAARAAIADATGKKQ